MSVVSVIYYIRIIRMCLFNEEINKHPISFILNLTYQQATLIALIISINIFFMEGIVI